MKYKVERFKEEDFEDASQVERIYMSIMQPNDFCLTHRDSEYAEVLNRAYPIICSLRQYAEKIQLILEIEHGKWLNQAVQIYNDSQSLYGRFDDINPKILRGVLTEKLRIIAEDMELLSKPSEDDDDKMIAAKSKAGEVASRNYERIAGIHNLKKSDDELVHTMPAPPMPKLIVHPIYYEKTKIENGEIVE